MLIEPSPEVQSALQLLRRGRFSETITLLQQHSKPLAKRKDQLASAILADAFQRTGFNREAENIAIINLRKNEGHPEANAWFHFVLGNVLRERSDLVGATKQFQIATTLPTSHHEFLCWAHLRLLATVADLNGRQMAIARLDEVKRILTRFGDPRPFAALHLWHVETDTIAGALENARRHLNIAESLLSNVDDVWLHGYLAINASVLNYYSADVISARQCAEKAASYAQASGHRTTRRAAYANLGYFEYSCGQLSKAEEYFEKALHCSEHGSANEIAILDNIAETKLERGDLEGCRSILSQIDSLAAHANDAKRRHYTAWALQTRIRLYLREDRQVDAKQLSREVQPILDELPHARLSAECRLLVSELLISTEPLAVADSLAPMFSDGAQLAPDLFAELERLSGKTLEASGAHYLARVHYDRAASVFAAIGHSLGKERSLRELTSLPDGDTSSPGDTIGVTLDRLRTLLDMRSRAELFGHEAMELLKELKCTASAHLHIEDYTDRGTQLGANPIVASASDSASEVRIVVGSNSHRKVTLAFVPLENPRARLTALSFKRVIGQILASTNTDATATDQEIVWPSSTAVEQGAVFASDVMRSVLRTVRQIASTDISVLITGETGSGKEVVAKSIHEHSRRCSMPFVAINCAAVPKDLLESQLFGHRKGAFSGASDAYQGIVRAANGGTLFLDEVGEIPLEMQAKLLRFLELNEVHPIGESHPIKVDVRLIFATNGDLEEAVNSNHFRRDLFYRINIIPIKLPALRERREEIPILVNVFAQRFARELSKEPLTFSAEAMENLIFYEWPGNIRQLANEVRRLSAVLESGACVIPAHLSMQLRRPQLVKGQTPRQGLPEVTVRIDQSIEHAISTLESEMIKHALRLTSGRVTDAAATLGISRKGLYLKRIRLGLLDFDGSRS
jgi:DNA-binding NtrC family response regulator/tetratricopeptide (TPR) repeat protein